MHAMKQTGESGAKGGSMGDGRGRRYKLLRGRDQIGHHDLRVPKDRWFLRERTEALAFVDHMLRNVVALLLRAKK